MTFLSSRTHQEELMDDPTIGFEEFQQTLHEIETINKRVGSYRPTFKALEALTPSSFSEPLRVLDIGFGNGDFLRHIYEWSQKKGIQVELSGVDLNPWAQKAAEKITPKEYSIQYFTSNIFDFKSEKPYHIIINSFFTHHLTNEEIVRVMQWMSSHAQLGWFINDLHRHPLPYYFIRYYVILMGYNRLVRNDAPLSVARSFTQKDWKNLIQQSKLPQDRFNISWYWPFRYGVRYASPR